MTDRLSLVYSPCTTSGQETEQVYSYNPGARTGLPLWINVHNIHYGIFISNAANQTSRIW